jgi:hypothetical protein
MGDPAPSGIKPLLTILFPIIDEDIAQLSMLALFDRPAAPHLDVIAEMPLHPFALVAGGLFNGAGDAGQDDWAMPSIRCHSMCMSAIGEMPR